MVTVLNKFSQTEPIEFALKQLEKSAPVSLEFELDRDDDIRSQGYKVEATDEKVHILASDEAGMMYGILDVAKLLKQGQEIQDREVTPYLENRGIKFNIPLDARTPSYSDASEVAGRNIENMWDFHFWTEFIDKMALNHYNVLSLWTLSPFPSLVRVPEYPEACIDDVKRNLRPYRATLQGVGIYSKDMQNRLVTVKKITIDQKIDFWRSVMEYAKNRCVKVFLFTWNLFVDGTEGNPYGIVCDQDNPVTRDFYYCGTKALMDTYPLLAGIGVTTGENMHLDETDEDFVADTYGRGITDYLKEHPEREFRFIHRIQMTKYKSIMDKFADFPCPFEISFKYSQAHMYSNTDPSFIKEFLEEKDKDLKIWLTVRNDDFYMYRWGDPDYAREYLQNMPVDDMLGYYMGADGYTWGRDYMDMRDLSHPMFVDKMWYMYMIWGTLSYDINLSKEFFVRELASKYHVDGTKLYETWKSASEIIPRFNCTHWHDFDFQWYPEGCCMYEGLTDKLVFADIHEFVECESAPGSNYYSVREYCAAAAKGHQLEKITPIETADFLYEKALLSLRGVEELRPLACGNDELNYALDDMQAMSYLGIYYAQKLKAAVEYCMYQTTGDTSCKEKAMELLKPAGAMWKRYSAKSRSMYKPQLLTRMCGTVDVQAFDELAEMDQYLVAEE
ncbi:putative uncharacterized protein [Clostridium sp. CAG:1013]|nr:putative uncharacterized protein [Clostridium sp. CAG:1013]